MSSEDLRRILSRLQDMEKDLEVIQRSMAGVKNRLAEVEMIADVLKPLAAVERLKEAEGR